MTSTVATPIDPNDIFTHLNRHNYDVSEIPSHIAVPNELSSRVLFCMLATKDLQPENLYENMRTTAGWSSDEDLCAQIVDANPDLDVDLDEIGDSLPLSLTVFREHVLDAVLRELAPAVHVDILAAAAAITGHSHLGIEDLELSGVLNA